MTQDRVHSHSLPQQGGSGVGCLIPKKVHQEKEKASFKSIKEHLMPSDKFNLNREWSILVVIISIISYSGKQHGKSLPGRMAQTRKSIRQSDEGNTRHE